MRHLSVGLIAIALCVGGCSKKDDSKKNDGDKAARGNKSTATPTPSKHATTKPDSPSKTATKAKPRVKMYSKQGVPGRFEFIDRDGITVSNEGYKTMFEARKRAFVAFKGDVTVGDKDCFIEVEVKLLDGAGKRVGRVETRHGAKAGEKITLTGMTNLSAEQAKTIKKMETVYWSLCGDKLKGYPYNPFALSAGKTSHKKVKWSVFNLEHTTATVASKAPARCYFNLFMQDLDGEGYLLAKDLRNLSIAAGTTKTFTIRRSKYDREHGKAMVPLIKSRRARLSNVECGTKPAGPAAVKLEGVEVSNIKLTKKTGKATSGDELLQQLYNLTATVKNTLGKDCAFDTAFAVLDKNNQPYHRGRAASKRVHLAAGTSGTLKASVWIDLGQVDEMVKTIVTKASPASKCKYFKADRALKP